MNLYSSRVKYKEQEFSYTQNSYIQNPIKEEQSSVIEGEFYQQSPMTVKEMIIRKMNKSLCCCLLATILVTFVSYYISMTYEADLNRLDNEIVRLNSENMDLQAELDRIKSFNNVDNKIGKYNLLQKAEKVIEVTALNSAQKQSSVPVKTASNNFNWAIGY